MRRYYFHVRHRTLALSNEGVILADDAEAWAPATTACGEMMRDLNGALKRGPEWRMEVVDEADRHLFTVHFGGSTSQ
jgi:hypothetical protein